MNAHTQMPPFDPFAPGVKASDVPVVALRSDVRFPERAPMGAQIATDFITKLFGEATESPIHFCSFGNERNGEHKPKSVNTRIPDRLSAFMAKWDIDGRGIFFGVGTLKDANIERSKANISEVSMLHADIDLKDVDDACAGVERKLKALKHPPSVMVFSGNGVHAYWKLTESIHNPVENGEVDRIETALRQICDVVGGDLQVCEIARVMRLPGSHNTKFGKRTPVAVVHSTDIKYELSDLEEWLAEQSPVILRKERPRAITLGEMDGFDLYLREIGFKPSIDVEKRLNGMMYMGFEEASVHWTQRDVTASMLSRDHSIDEVVDILIKATKTAAGQYGERWNWEAEERAIRKDGEKWLREHPPKVKTKPTAQPESKCATEASTVSAITPKSDAPDTTKESKTKADLLIKLTKGVELFHNVENACFADIVHGGHRETWPTKSIHFKHWLTGLYYKATGTALKADDLATAINAIEAKARFESPQREVHLRVGGFNGKFYLDLGNKDWEVVEIDADGWRIIKDPPIRFRRTRSTLPLAAPVQGGSVELLRKYVNVKTDDDFVLLVFWLLAGIRPAGPYPILMVSGEHGAAKSTATKVARSIVDPNVVDVRSPPKDDQNLFIAAENSHILAYDNISNLPPWLSDSFCRIATGAGYASRKLYEDNEEVLLNVIKPLVLNGINEMVSRADLTDRAILLNLAAIGDKTRISEEDLWREFEIDRPPILGALLDAVSHGIKTLPSVKLERLPRMADFAKWSNACEEAVFKKGTFTKAYNDNINETIGKVIENDVVASAVIQFFRMLPASTGRQWIGSAEELLHELRAYVPDQASHQNEC